jgi:hypothetical protein
LLTALIIDAYDAVGEATERAAAPPAAGRARWIAACRAIRDWARSNPHEYALIYGSPVPGYRAPEATIGPASRVPVAFADIVSAASANGELGGGQSGPGGRAEPPAGGELAAQAAATVAALSVPGVPPGALVRAVIAWTQLIGMISFELFGQFVGSFDPPDALFGFAVGQLAAFIGFAEA